MVRKPKYVFFAQGEDGDLFGWKQKRGKVNPSKGRVGGNRIFYDAFRISLSKLKIRKK